MSEAQVTAEALGEKIDLVWSIRSQRMELERQAAQLEEDEKVMKAEILKLLQASEVTILGGALAIASREPKTIPAIREWATLYQHIQATGEFDLLQKRLGEAAVKERWDEGLAVPGVDKLPMEILKITAKKGGA